MLNSRQVETLLEQIARLASMKLQERFITHATVDNYYVVEELLDCAFGAAPALLCDLRFFEPLSERAKTSVRAFEATLRREADRVDLAASDLVHADPSWAAIRTAASRCLADLGFDLAAFESKEASPDEQ